MNLRPHIASAIAVFAVMLCGCEPGKPSFLSVQMCLGDAENLKDLKDRLRLIARSERMEFIDASSDIKQQLEAIGAGQAGPIIHMEVDREDGLGLTATNLGLPGYQVGIGFTEGSTPPEGHAFARRVVDLLKTQWRISTVPAGRGAFPLKDCAQK